ncbi:helix-turn-helix domain-containing protein [Acetobacter cibinongensis]|uniref:HTH cro/C1-type domain-containing protein n=1 Tax=Acetobacter cibinongensis TaxID=146475 RepID=A0A1Z5YTC9_9PROT|nr:helix-turn-helix transcriptional regulator [Acetobacter cibinongensis]OUJ01551.1 hypothetical protein HK14_08955 [Acetobacter cibinongensis]
MNDVNVNADDLAVSVGQIIQRERKKRGWTALQLCHESNRAIRTIERIELGGGGIKLNVLFDILYALDCGNDVFLEIAACDASIRNSASAVKREAA